MGSATTYIDFGTKDIQSKDAQQHNSLFMWFREAW